MLKIDNLTIRYPNGFCLENISWQLNAGEHVVLYGENGAGKSVLTAYLAGLPLPTADIVSGTVLGDTTDIAIVSKQQLALWRAQELQQFERHQLDNSQQGLTVADMLAAVPAAKLQQLVERFKLSSLLERRFRLLSTGERMKLLLISALSRQPALLILDDPFAGLDHASVAALQQILCSLQPEITLLLVTNRLADIPDYFQKIVFLQQGKLVLQQAWHPTNKKTLLAQYSESASRDSSPSVERTDTTTQLAAVMALAKQTSSRQDSQPLAVLKQIQIHYDERPLFIPFDWTIKAGEHWQLCGDNGSGKSSLLALLTGDHPQCYSNNMVIFGYQRGSGESIWQIKQHIGLVSAALQQQYRAVASLQQVVLSGLYDSIGVYQQPTPADIKLAQQWLHIIGMAGRKDQRFTELSDGDQRLVLIARAMIKQPALLILDEPCLGLDEHNKAKVLALISQLCEQGASTVLYVSHQTDETIPAITQVLNLNLHRAVAVAPVSAAH